MFFESSHYIRTFSNIFLHYYLIRYKFKNFLLSIEGSYKRRYVCTYVNGGLNFVFTSNSFSAVVYDLIPFDSISLPFTSVSLDDGIVQVDSEVFMGFMGVEPRTLETRDTWVINQANGTRREKSTWN